MESSRFDLGDYSREIHGVRFFGLYFTYNPAQADNSQVAATAQNQKAPANRARSNKSLIFRDDNR